MPVVSYCSVSDSPPMVAVACFRDGFTCRLALKSRAFSLCILDSSHVKKMESLAATSGSKVRDKLAAAGLKHFDGKEAKAPVIEGATATLLCDLKSSKAYGDHVMLVGEVKGAEASSAFRGSWDFRRYSPVLYTGWDGGMTTYAGGARPRGRPPLSRRTAGRGLRSRSAGPGSGPGG
jgi:flavin reductase (DIM6/NTAB) family NADH-FMN oxidoreductase RutF